MNEPELGQGIPTFYGSRDARSQGAILLCGSVTLLILFLYFENHDVHY